MKKGKIIITGTGRAGTSFLVVLLTRLGLDTGYKPYIEDFNEKIRAGCEYKLFSTYPQRQQKLLKNTPRILKHPKFSHKLAGLIKNNMIKVDHIIVPVRNIKDAAKSRIKAKRRWKIKGLGSQEQVLAWALGKITETACQYNIPITYIKYPKLVQDPEYCFNKLSTIFKLNKKKFTKVYHELAGAKKIKQKIGLARKLIYKLT
ncbi:hypothetical protein KKG65_02740 [Patescibacteria group bacterium]|nr:hypothetical protein [Patescibacteria group bacterium]